MAVTLAARLEDVTVVDDQGRALLDALSMVVMAGEALAVCGPSGGGKTTVLRLLGGMLEPASGVVEVGGVRRGGGGYEATRAWRQGVGLALEGGFWSNRTVFENLALPLLYHEPDAPGLEARVAALAGELGIAGDLGLLGGAASVSVRRRALLGRALLREPALLLIDEPQLGLMPREARRVSDAIEARRRQRGLSVVYADRDGSVVPFVCERRVFLEAGRQVERLSAVISQRDLASLDRALVRSSLTDVAATDEEGAS